MILTGAGKAFCVGGDLQMDARRGRRGARRGAAVWRRKFHAGIEALAALDAPVISAVRGAAAGGGMSLAIAADIVLAAESARFTMAYTAIGFSPDGGSTWTLPRLVGARRAAELMLLNERLEPAAARELGLVNRVVADDALDAEADALARRLADGPTPRTAASSGCCARPATRDFREQLAEEARTIAGLAGAPDGREGVAAFLEKRAPHSESS